MESESIGLSAEVTDGIQLTESQQSQLKELEHKFSAEDQNNESSSAQQKNENESESLIDVSDIEPTENKQKEKEDVNERPDWLRKEFKSTEDQAKAYNELFKKLGSFAKAPDEYSFENITNDEFKINRSGKNAQEFAGLAKEMNMTQETFEKVVGFFNEKVAPTIKHTENKIDKAEEMKKLGPDAKQKISNVSQWAANHFGEKAKVIQNMVKTADEVQILLDIIDKTNPEPSMPSNNDSKPTTEKDLQKKLEEALKLDDVAQSFAIDEIGKEFQKFYG